MRHLLLAAALLSAFALPADARTRRARATGAATASDTAAPASSRATRAGASADNATPAASRSGGSCTQASPCTGPRGGRYYMSGTRKVYLHR